MFFGFLFLIWILALLVAVGMLIVFIFHLITLSRTLELCHPYTRKMNPGEVWMVLIPVFGVVWHFFVVGRLADSLAIEFRNRNLPVEEERPGYNAGLTALILLLCGGIIPVLGLIAALIFLIRYWNQISEYKKRLEQHNAQFTGAPSGFQPPPAPVQYPNYPPPNSF
jgi:hypothetical protein